MLSRRPRSASFPTGVDGTAGGVHRPSLGVFPPIDPVPQGRFGKRLTRLGIERWERGLAGGNGRGSGAAVEAVASLGVALVTMVKPSGREPEGHIHRPCRS